MKGRGGSVYKQPNQQNNQNPTYLLNPLNTDSK